MFGFAFFEDRPSIEDKILIGNKIKSNKYDEKGDASTV